VQYKLQPYSPDCKLLVKQGAPSRKNRTLKCHTLGISPQ